MNKQRFRFERIGNEGIATRVFDTWYGGWNYGIVDDFGNLVPVDFIQLSASLRD